MTHQTASCKVRQLTVVRAGAAGAVSCNTAPPPPRHHPVPTALVSGVAINANPAPAGNGDGSPAGCLMLGIAFSRDIADGEAVFLVGGSPRSMQHRGSASEITEAVSQFRFITLTEADAITCACGSSWHASCTGHGLLTLWLCLSCTCRDHWDHDCGCCICVKVSKASGLSVWLMRVRVGGLTQPWCDNVQGGQGGGTTTNQDCVAGVYRLLPGAAWRQRVDRRCGGACSRRSDADLPLCFRPHSDPQAARAQLLTLTPHIGIAPVRRLHRC